MPTKKNIDFFGFHLNLLKSYLTAILKSGVSRALPIWLCFNEVITRAVRLIRARCNYVVVQVLFDRPDAKLHQVGVYYDKFRRVGEHLKLAERRCVYDNLLVDNALCLPV